MTTIKARLIAVTKPTFESEIPTSEDLISYCARVSNPSNQNKFDTSKKLINYCLENKHYSILEMANAIVEVEAPRDITRQLLRHRSFSFQEFSQRYSDDIEFTDREFRRQDTRNRQNSTDDLDEDIVDASQELAKGLVATLSDSYKQMVSLGVAKECARVILPEGLTMSKLYVNGNLRSWLHYLEVRDGPGVTQHEHVVLAREIRKVLEPAFPNIIKGVVSE